MQVYLVLFEGRSGADPLFLQVKQAAVLGLRGRICSPAGMTITERGSSTESALVQSATDIFAGWGSLHGRDFYVRQFRDMKIIPTHRVGRTPPHRVRAPPAATALARAHARTGDPVAIDSYIGKGPKFAAAIGRFAEQYADQNERDHAQLVDAVAAGAVQSLPG